LKETKDSKKRQSLQSDSTSLKETPFLLVKGFLMGSADIIPGVSGGTMALITGIYDRLIDAIKSFDGSVVMNILKFRFSDVLSRFHWKFLIILLSGILGAILFFTKIVPLQVYMFTHPEIIYGLFFGLIAGSIVLLLKEIETGNRTPGNALMLLTGAIVGFLIVNMVPTNTPETFWYVFLSGSVAICAMILPGISGAYILLIFQKYDYILTQIGDLGGVATADAVINLVPFAAGAVFGLVLFSRALSWLLHNYHAATLLFLIGFLVGSLYVIWPWQDREYKETVRSTEVYPVTDPLVQELRENPPETNRPQYKRLGDVLTPNAAFDEFKRVEVEIVSKKLVSSTPYIPSWNNGTERNPDIAGGLGGMAAGILMIGLIAYLRKT